MMATMIEAALRALVLAAAVGLGLTVLRVRNVPARKAAWSAVLAASLGMPFLLHWPAALMGRFAWAAPVKLAPSADPLQAIPSSAAATGEAINEEPMVSARSVPVASGDMLTDAGAIPVPPGREKRAAQWPAPARLMIWIYLAVSGALLLRLLYGLIAALRLWVTADEVSPLDAPEGYVRASRRIASPVTIGSGIVLPADYGQWERSKLRMVLAHERSHVRQLDFYLQLLAGLYAALFWFSPLGWLLRRTLASLGETIADRAGVSAAANRSSYAEVVLEFAAMPRRNLQGVAMACSGNLAQRIDAMLNDRVFRSAFTEGRRRAAAALLLIPAALFAVTALVRVPVASAQASPVAPSLPAVTSSGAAPMAGPAQEAAPAQKTPAPPQPAPAAAPAPPVAAKAGTTAGRSATSALRAPDEGSAPGAHHPFDSNGGPWAIVRGPGSDVTFFGKGGEGAKAQIDAARRMAQAPFLWFRHEGKSYIVDDPAVVAQVEGMYQPMEALAGQQEAFGKQQEKLGRQMEALAQAQEATARVQMPDFSREMAQLQTTLEKFRAEQGQWNMEPFVQLEAKLRAEQGRMLSQEQMAEIQAKVAAVQAKLTPERMAEIQEKIAAVQAKLGRLQGEAGSRQGQFGQRMGALGAQQGKLGAEQGRLGAEQGRLAQQLDREVRNTIEQALRTGKARPVQ